jgi:hypothetical protein
VKFAGRSLFCMSLFVNADKNGTVIPHVHGSFRIAFGHIRFSIYIHNRVFTRLCSRVPSGNGA